jgi:hypothetical protein
MIVHYNPYLISKLPKQEIEKYQDFFVPDFENVLEKYKEQTKLLGSFIFSSFQSTIDRTNKSEHILKIKNLYPIVDYDPNFNKPFQELCLERAKYLLSLNKIINVFWSGGLDSTNVLFSLLAYRKHKDQIIVQMNYNSILESGYIFDTFIKPNFLYNIEVFKLENINFNENEIYLTGHPADLLGWIGIHKNTMDIFSKNKENLKNDNDYREHLDDSILNWMTPSIEAFPKPIKTVSDLLWFWGFNYRWQNQGMCPFHVIRNDNLKEKYHDTVFGFYDNEDFQRWSMSNTETDFSQTDSKSFIKKTIYNLGGPKTENYIKNKHRTPSSYMNWNRNYLFTKENYENVYVSDEVMINAYGVYNGK